MSLEKYNKIRLVAVVVISLIISQSLALKNFIIPLFTVIIGSLVLMLLRRKVDEVIADERDYVLAGKSALLAIQIYSWISVIIMFALYSLSDLNPANEPVAKTLAFSVCGLMILYSIIFRLRNKSSFLTVKDNQNEKSNKGV